MEVLQEIKKYINSYKVGEPIFTQDIVEYIKAKGCQTNDKSLVTYINRVSKQIVDLRTFKKGIYYLTKGTSFGFAPINLNEVFVKRYLRSNGQIIGYETGPSFMQKIGLTTQTPKYKYLATTKVKVNRIDNAGNIYLIKANRQIVEQNYRYFQLLDVMSNHFGIAIECDNEYDVYKEYLVRNNLTFEKLLYYAFEYKNSDKLIKKVAFITKGAR